MYILVWSLVDMLIYSSRNVYNIYALGHETLKYVN